jgi:hypothetical protein
MKLDAYEKELLKLDDAGQISFQSPDLKEKEALIAAARETLQKINESISVCPVAIFSLLSEKPIALACLIKP